MPATRQKVAHPATLDRPISGLLTETYWMWVSKAIELGILTAECTNDIAALAHHAAPWTSGFHHTA